MSNVTNFGAFVDLGVHQDGLVHISEITHKFTRDPLEIIKVGEIVKVKVLNVDIARRRIDLSMKLDPAPKKSVPQPKYQPKPKSVVEKPIFNTAMADALTQLKQKMHHGE